MYKKRIQDLNFGCCYVTEKGNKKKTEEKYQVTVYATYIYNKSFNYFVFQ